MVVPDADQSGEPGLGRYDSGPDMTTERPEARAGYRPCRGLSVRSLWRELSPNSLPRSRNLQEAVSVYCIVIVM